MTNRPLKIYHVTTSSDPRKHSVVAENMCAAERLFLAAYPSAHIREIILHSESVIFEGASDETA